MVADQFVLDAGGLVGLNSEGGTIRASYATGDVTGVAPDYLVGGLIGRIVGDSSTVTASYATGTVTGASFVGGLLGYDQGTNTTFTDSYWDTEASGVATSAGAGPARPPVNCKRPPTTRTRIRIPRTSTRTGT